MVFVKVENEGMHHKKYNGHCMKQQIRVQKTTWTSPILRKRFTCRTSFKKASLMKDDVKIKMPNKTLKIIMPSNKVVNLDRVLNSSGWPCYTFLRLDKKTYWFKNVFIRMMQLKKDLWCECHLQWMEINKKGND
jgi:hypothetical protein